WAAPPSIGHKTPNAVTSEDHNVGPEQRCSHHQWGPVEFLLQIAREQSPNRVVNAKGRPHPQATRMRIEQQAAFEDGEQESCDLGLHLPLLAFVLDPNLELLHVVSNPNDDEGRQYADPQKAAPTDVIVEEAVGYR